MFASKLLWNQFSIPIFLCWKVQDWIVGRVYNAGVEEFQVEMVHLNTLCVMAISLQSCLIHDHEAGSGKMVGSVYICVLWPVVNTILKHFSSVQDCYFIAIYSHPGMLFFWFPLCIQEDSAPAKVFSVVEHSVQPLRCRSAISMVLARSGIWDVPSGAIFDLMCLQYRERCTFTSPYTLSNPSPYALTVVLEKQLNYMAPWCDFMLLSHMVGKPEKLMSGGKTMEDKERGKPVCIIKRNWDDKTKTHRRK